MFCFLVLFVLSIIIQIMHMSSFYPLFLRDAADLWAMKAERERYFGIRTLWTAAVCGDSREVRFHLSIYYSYRPIMVYDTKRTVWFRKNASMPCRADQGFVEAFADTKSCYGLLRMPGIIAFWRNHTVLFGSQPIDGRFHISYHSSESLLPGGRTT